MNLTSEERNKLQEMFPNHIIFTPPLDDEVMICGCDITRIICPSFRVHGVDCQGMRPAFLLEKPCNEIEKSRNNRKLNEICQVIQPSVNRVLTCVQKKTMESDKLRVKLLKKALEL